MTFDFAYDIDTQEFIIYLNNEEIGRARTHLSSEELQSLKDQVEKGLDFLLIKDNNIIGGL